MILKTTWDGEIGSTKDEEITYEYNLQNRLAASNTPITPPASAHAPIAIMSMWAKATNRTKLPPFTSPIPPTPPTTPATLSR
ncbi:MAG: hypothetical protein JXD22_08470 [Sedimentisphaerales bacterium]|nr:hypothetical protein [Sedimentisphaerales bacterium]